MQVRRIRALGKRSQQKQLFEEMSEVRWQGKLFKIFAWLEKRRSCSFYTIAGVDELYQQLLPTKLYHHKKVRTYPNQDVLCRMFGKRPESVLSRSSTLKQTKYLSRYNAVLKILSIELLKDLKLVSKVQPWYSPVQSKLIYENASVKASWMWQYLFA